MPPEDSESTSSEKTISSEQDKVELDLDDAPFLDFDDDEEEKETSPVEEEVKLEPVEQKSETPKKSKTKFIIFGGLGSLAVAGGIGFWLFLRTTTPPEPPSPPPPKVEKKVPKPEPQPEEEPLIPEERRVVKLQPFFIEYQQGDQSRFLECSLSLSAPNILQNDELRRHMIEIRDALYFYLKNKDIFFLENQKNAEQFKKEVLDVINQHMVFKPVTYILIDKYLVR